MNHAKIIFFLCFCVIFTHCAKRGFPEGGPKDESPPFLVNANPKENSINFDEKRIRLFFDEYIKLEDFRKQLVVSPPIEKSLYSISPQSGASKYIQIDINDTLPRQQTYVFNFGQSVIDNNERNVLPFFKYVFSTGNYIDSLKISGNIKNSFKREDEKFISILLYPFVENFSDSIIYNSIPTYVGSTLDSTYFEISNLKKGKYLLIGLNDSNNDYKFNPDFEEIGFMKNFIEIPYDKEINLEIFKEEIIFKSFKPFIQSNNNIAFGFKGKYQDVKIELIDSFQSPFKSILTKSKETDTLNYWFSNIKYDSLRFVVKSKTKNELHTVYFKEKEKDSLIITSSNNGSIDLNETFKLFSNIPIQKIENNQISILNKDSISIPFETKIDENNFDVVFNFELLPNDDYKLLLLPNALKDFLGSVNDTLSYDLSTKSRSDYGLLKLAIQNQKSYPIIVQLTDFEEKVVREKILKSNLDACIFENLNPAQYYLKIIFDENNNEKWDTGNFLNKVFPEKIYHYDEKIIVRANWILEEKIILEDE